MTESGRLLNASKTFEQPISDTGPSLLTEKTVVSSPFEILKESITIVSNKEIRSKIKSSDVEFFKI